jgi:AraC family transcriptional regulator
MVIKLQAGAFYGATAKTVEMEGFRFTEKSHTPQSNLPRHSHELAHFCFVLAGNYSEKLSSLSLERTPSTLIFYPPDVSHAEKRHTKGRDFLIEIEPLRTDYLRDYGVVMSEPTSFTNESANWLAAKLHREFRHMDGLSMLALEATALELIVETLRCRANSSDERRTPKWLDEVKEFLQASFLEPPSLDCLAKTVGVHPVHLVRAFRKFQHCTVSEYVRRLRIDYARQRMLSSNDSLVEIALSSGFADQTHFSRSFKRVTGTTPSEFRRISHHR